MAKKRQQNLKNQMIMQADIHVDPNIIGFKLILDLLIGW